MTVILTSNFNSFHFKCSIEKQTDLYTDKFLIYLIALNFERKNKQTKNNDECTALRQSNIIIRSTFYQFIIIARLCSKRYDINGTHTHYTDGTKLMRPILLKNGYFNIFPHTKKIAAKKTAIGGATKVGKAGPVVGKIKFPVEKDPHKLVNYCCGSNIYVDGEDVKVYLIFH